MPSLGNTSTNARSMNGLNNIDANSINTNDLVVGNLTISGTGLSTTPANTDNSAKIATTAFVKNAISDASSNLVTLNTAQTITATKTFSVLQNIPIIKGQYIDLFAGQIRMFSGSGGGSAIYFYVPPSGRSIMDFSSTNCDMVGQYNLTSNNITSSIVPSSGYEYTNKDYVDNAVSTSLSGYVDISNAQTITGQKSIKDTFLKFNNSFNSQYGTIGYNALNQWLSLSSTNNFNINAGGNTTYSNGGGIFNIKSNNLTAHTILNLNDIYDNTLFKFDCFGSGNTIYSYYPLTINATNPIFTSNAGCSIAPSNSSDYTNKSYVDSAISTSTTNLLNSNNYWNGVQTFDNSITANFSIINNDVASFQNGAFFDNVCPYSTVPPTGAQDLTQKSYVDNNFVGLTGTQTITGTKTFNNFSVNQTGGTDINLKINTAGSDNIVMDFAGLTTLQYHYANALNRTIIKDTNGKDMFLTTTSGTSLLLSNSSGNVITNSIYVGSLTGASFVTVAKPIYNGYDPTTISWNTTNFQVGYSNASDNIGTAYSGTASNTATPANVGSFDLPCAGVWHITISVLGTLNGGSSTITDRLILLSPVSGTSLSSCGPGFEVRDPINDAAGSAGARQKYSLCGIYHYITGATSTTPKTLYINAIWASARTVTVTGNIKFTRIA